MEEVKKEETKTLDFLQRVQMLKRATLSDPEYSKNFYKIRSKFNSLSKKQMLNQLASFNLEIAMLQEVLLQLEEELNAAIDEAGIYDGTTDDHGNPLPQEVKDEDKQ